MIGGLFWSLVPVLSALVLFLSSWDFMLMFGFSLSLAAGVESSTDCSVDAEGTLDEKTSHMIKVAAAMAFACYP